MTLRVTGLLLAAGLSSRMGAHKALLAWQGVPLVAYQVQQLRQAGACPVIVVIGHGAGEIGPVAEAAGAHTVFNPDYVQGRATSIRAGARAITDAPDALILLNVDQPRRAATIAHLLAAHERSDALLTVPTFAGRRGHPVVIDGSLLTELQAVEEATAGLRAVTRRYADRRQQVEMPTPEILLDINEPQTYLVASRAWAEPPQEG